MKKLILIALITFSLSAERFEYLIGELRNLDYKTANFTIPSDVNGKYDTIGGDIEDRPRGIVLITALNLLGEDGWELIDSGQIASAVKFYLFKRKINN